MDPAGAAYREAIAAAPDFDTLKAAITQVYARSGPQILAQRIAEALALAELAAMYGLTEDCPLRPTALEMNAGRWRIPRLFTEAARWLSERIEKASSVPITYSFGERPVERAPEVAAATQLDSAARLRAAVELAETEGRSLPEARSELYALLKELGCEPAPHSHPIIIEELQSRFARTRETILSLDFYRAAYPFWRYSSVLDDRTTEGCRALDGLTMPASDPRWVGFVPPRHWRCRAHVIAVVHSLGAAAKKTEPDMQYSGEGSFGTLKDEWEPRPGSYPQDLWEIYAAAKDIASPHIELAGKWWRKDYNPDDEV